MIRQVAGPSPGEWEIADHFFGSAKRDPGQSSGASLFEASLEKMETSVGELASAYGPALWGRLGSSKSLGRVRASGRLPCTSAEVQSGIPDSSSGASLFEAPLDGNGDLCRILREPLFEA